MQNDFPKTEKVEFEEIYGQKRIEASPHRSKYVFNMRIRQKIKCDTRALSNYKNIFSSGDLKNIEDEIVKRSHEGYISLSNLSRIDYKISKILFVYKALEQRGTINVNCVVEDSQSKKEKVEPRLWNKKDILKLLEAIEVHGDDWTKVSESVGRSKAECILCFLKMDFGLNKLISSNIRMSQLVFIASNVHPVVGSAAAKEFIMSYGKEPEWNKIISKALEQIELEKTKINRLENVIIESEILKIKQKILDYKQMAESIDKEKDEIREHTIEINRKIQELINFAKEIKKT